MKKLMLIILVIFMTSCSDKMYISNTYTLQDLNENVMEEEIDKLGDSKLEVSVTYNENCKIQIYNSSNNLVGCYILHDINAINLLCNLPINSNLLAKK